MLTSLHIENFKAWADTGPLRLAPLTVIFGANSAGKSSLGQLLLALKQTVLAADRRRALQLGDAQSLVDLGSFADCLHRHELDRSLRVALGWTLPRELEVKDALSPARFRGDTLQLDVSLDADARAQPRVCQLGYRLQQRGGTTLAVDYRRSAGGRHTLTAQPLALQRVAGKAAPLEPPEKFYRFSDQSRARFRNAGFLADLALQTEALFAGLHHLGPLREQPRRLYGWSGEAPENVGQRGEHSIAAILAASAQGRRLATGAGAAPLRFDAFVAHWLRELGVIERFRLRPLVRGRHEVEVLVTTHADAGEVRLTDVGFGVSQVLPALVEAFYCTPGSTVWMEQPEVHLHPQVQAALADALIGAIHAHEGGQPRGVQLIIESHSEHLLNRLQRRVAEGAVAAGDIAVHFCRRADGGAALEPLRMNRYGEIENWPENFFGDEMADIAGRTLAALRRRQAEHG